MENVTAYKVRIYTGPVEVSAMTQRIRSLGFPILSEGTESVWCRVVASDALGAIVALQAKLGNAYGARWIPRLSECRAA